MRLLSTSNASLQPPVLKPPRYAILSHTWGDDEVSFDRAEDITNGPPWSAGATKCYNACRVAREKGYQRLWIDTCCIDKKNSTELSEAINSMFRYYAESEVCYAYLGDVPDDDDITHRHSKFRSSRWFTRGWTLQELLAPKRVHFYSKDWRFLGTKDDLKGIISSITRIPEEVLAGEDCQPPTRSIAEVLSWASRRHTTVVEDTAYSLLGLLDINMPLLYGEGSKAFLRLQEELLKKYDDESLFAWEAPPNDALAQPYFGLLSPSVSYFEASHRFRHPTIRTRIDDSTPTTSTNKGISTTFPRIDVDKSNGLYFALLDCRIQGINEGEIQSAIQVHHLVGNQYARVDVHHIHDVRLDRLTDMNMFYPNCPMIFPAKPQPPRPITGFIISKEQKTHELVYFSGTPFKCGIRLVDSYPPHRWDVLGPGHMALNFNPRGNSNPSQPKLPDQKLMGAVTVRHFAFERLKDYGAPVHILFGTETTRGCFPGAPERRNAWAFLMPAEPTTSLAEIYQNPPSQELSERPSRLRVKLGKTQMSHLNLDISEQQWAGKVFYQISLTWVIQPVEEVASPTETAPSR